jgi:tetratricopeptide (TPR) repeat protein
MASSVPPPSSKAPSRPSRAGQWLLALTLAGSVLALGALHTETLVFVALVLGASCFVLWFGARPIVLRPAATALLLLGIGLIAFTLLQCIPMPMSVLRALAPENADVWSRCLLPLREVGPSWAPISLDPGATRVQALRGVTYLLAFLASLRIAARHQGTSFLEAALVASVGAFAILTLMHPALGLERVFGAYQPINATAFAPQHMSPLLNVNHQAAYLNLGACTALGVALSPRPAFPKLIALAVAAFLIGTELWTMSRGGTMGLVAGIVCVLLLARLLRAEVGTLRADYIVGAPVLLGVVAAVLSSATVRAKLASGDLSKLELARQSLSLARKFAGFGIGRGAFESVFPSMRQGSDHWVYTHPENVIAQWLCEWGFVVGVVGLLVLAWALRPRMLEARVNPPIGAWGALAALAVHNVVDFNSEVPAIMIAASVCAALVVAGSTSSRPRPFTIRWGANSSRVALGAASAAVIVSLLACSTLGEDLASDQRALQPKTLDHGLTNAEYHAALRAAILRHPAEPYFPFLGALRVTLRRDDNIVPWIARTLERAPVYGRAHLLLARWLFSRAPSQARLEYRIAYEQDATLRSAVLAECVPLVHSYEDAIQLAPAGIAGVQMLEALARAVDQRLPASRVRIDEEILARDPRAVAPLQRAVRDATADVRAGDSSPWCSSKATCLEDAMKRADSLRALAPSSCEGHALFAELRITKGEVDEALGELDRAIDSVDDRPACLRRYVELAAAAHRSARVDAGLDKLLLGGCTVPADCVSSLQYAAHIEESRGHSRRALAFYKKALERDPGREDLLETIATSSSRLGLHAEAAEAYEKLAERHPDDPRWGEAARRERAATHAEVLRLAP